MSFPKAFQRKITAVRIRCGLNLLLRQAGVVLGSAGAAAVLVLLAEHLLAVRIVVPAVFWVFWGVVVASILILWFFKLPTRMQASLLLDERLKLHERSSTTLALGDSDDPFAKAAREESLRVIERANLRGHFPIGLSRSWYYGAGTWLAVIAVVLFMPEKDLLGLLKKKQQEEQEIKKLEDAKADVKRTADSVKAAVKELHEPALEEALKKLDEVAQAGQPQEAKREAIKALGELSDRLKQMQGGGQLEAANMMQQTLRRLKGSADPFSQQIRVALAKGDFAQAANMLGQLQKELTQGKLSDQQRKDMADQLQRLAKELQKLAEQKRELEEELQKLGLDKKLAELSEQKLRQMLQQQGLTPDLVDQVMKKMAASQAASSKCAGLAMAMAACGAGTEGLSADDMADALDQLNALESLQQQAMLLQGSLNEIGRGVALLGAGMYEGVGPQAPFQEGYSDTMGPGSGGPGSGFGPRSSDTQGQTGTKPAKANSASGQGAVIASWYFKDVQIKGEARRDFVEVVEAGRANAAEAISENQIPRKYEDAMKKYFGQLEQRKPQP